MSAFKTDGSQKVNSKVLTIGSSSGGSGGTAYVAENISLSRPSAEINRNDENDEPDASYNYEKDVNRITCTLQYPSSTAVAPSKGWETTITFDATRGAQIFYVYELGDELSQGAETKIPCTLKAKIN